MPRNTRQEPAQEAPRAQATHPVTIKSQTDDTATVAGWGVVFGGRDLYGDHFTKDTDFWFDRLPGAKPVLYDHGFNDGVQLATLGTTASIEARGDGLWVEAEINKHTRYWESIQELIDGGYLGWSSGSVAHLVEYGKNAEIKSWPIVEFSLTPTPAEPRTLGVQQLRALVDHAEELKSLLAEEAPRIEGASDEPRSEPPTPAVRTTPTPSEEPTVVPDTNTMTISQEALDALAKSIGENFTATFESQLKTRLDPITAALAALEAEPASTKAGFVSDTGGTTDKPVKSFADYLLAVRRGDEARLVKVYGVKAALAEDGGTTGGYLVPTEFVAKLLQAAAENAIVRSRAYIQPMTTRDLQLPALDQQTAPTAGNTAFFGGVQMQWVGEGGAYTETEPKFRMIELVAHKLQGYALASNEMLADSAIALESLLTRLFGGAIAWYEDYAFLNGTGAGQPLGIKNAAALINVSRNTASQIKVVDLGNMLSKMLPSSYRSAIWVAHPYTIPQLVQLALANATVVSWIPNLRENIPATLLGLPVVFSEKMQPLGTAFDLGLFDLSYYVVGDRQQITIAASEHYRFTNGQITWRVDERIDGQPWVKSSITLADASSTVSPFVGLQ